MIIRIKNIKGYGDPAGVLDLDLKTNRVNIIFAPNGTGKSSLAMAFRSLLPRRLEVAKDDKFHKDEALVSELVVEDGGVTYVADTTKNDIGQLFTPYVINCGTVVSTTQQNVGGRYTNVKGYLDIENIVVVENIPPVVVPSYQVTAMRQAFGTNGKLLANNSIIFGDAGFWLACEQVGHLLDFFPRAKKRMALIDAVMTKVQAMNGTVAAMMGQMDADWFVELEADQTYTEVMQVMAPYTAGFSQFKCFDFFWQLLQFWAANKQSIKRANGRTSYERLRQRFDSNLNLLDATWRNIHTEEEGQSLVVKFPHADEISNGQRDLLTFVVELLKFKSQLTDGTRYLLLIDEVFDYLDDANIITAQYFLSQFLDLNKGNMYLCLLTHLNPFTFRNYIFSAKKLHFLYLKPTLPAATPTMMAYISFRSGLDRNVQAQSDLYDRLSHDLYHYNPIVVDYSAEIAALRTNGALRPSWGKTQVLHQALIDEVNKYLTGQPSYDPYAVAMALRLKVEKNIYEELPTQALKDAYVDEKMTKNKFAFAEANGVMIPEVLNIVNAIHNEADHLRQDPVTQQYEERAMVYKLQNRAIQMMIMHIFGWKGQLLTTTSID